jgi:hypothetical protein
MFSIKQKKILLKKVLQHIAKEIRWWVLPRPQRILFEHIPKCGGSTVFTWLKSQFPDRFIYGIKGYSPTESRADFISLSDRQRHGYFLVFGHSAHKLLGHSHPESNPITLFRDPLEKVVSLYYHAKQDKNHYLHESACKMEALDFILSEISPELHNNFVYRFTGIPHSTSNQNPEEAVSKTIDALRKYRFITTVDFLDEAMPHAQTLFSFPKKYPCGSCVGRRNRPREILSEEIRNKMESVNIADCMLYAHIHSKLSGKHTHGIDAFLDGSEL